MVVGDFVCGRRVRDVEDEGVFSAGWRSGGEDVAGIYHRVIELGIAGNLFDDECSLPDVVGDCGSDGSVFGL